MSGALPQGFVYLNEIDSTIQKSLRYFSVDNFIGKSVMGYEADVVVTTLPVAQKLKEIQFYLKEEGYELVVYDAYRPQMAVDEFADWSKNRKDQKMKSWFYPGIDKSRAFELGYISKKSQHSRGSAVDVTLLKLGSNLHKIIPQSRIISDGSEIVFLDDGTVDMGSSFDLFSEASHYENNLIADQYKSQREYLKNVMIKFGFLPYSKEWWHFSLAENELFPKTFFNFLVR